MIGIVVVTHGKLADEMIESAKLIVGSIDAIEGVSIAPMMTWTTRKITFLKPSRKRTKMVRGFNLD